jgi:hypothetical protein
VSENGVRDVCDIYETQIKTIIYDLICVGRRAFLFMTSLEPRVAGPVRPATLAAPL